MFSDLNMFSDTHLNMFSDCLPVCSRQHNRSSTTLLYWCSSRCQGWSHSLWTTRTHWYLYRIFTKLLIFTFSIRSEQLGETETQWWACWDIVMGGPDGTEWWPWRDRVMTLMWQCDGLDGTVTSLMGQRDGPDGTVTSLMGQSPMGQSGGLHGTVGWAWWDRVVALMGQCGGRDGKVGWAWWDRVVALMGQRDGPDGTKWWPRWDRVKALMGQPDDPNGRVMGESNGHDETKYDGLFFGLLTGYIWHSNVMTWHIVLRGKWAGGGGSTK